MLTRVLAQLGAAAAATLGPGDDCATLRVGGELVVTTDTMVEGPDFRLDWHTGYELGWKLAATNLSDVAAMGAKPVGLTVAFACPKRTPLSLLEDISAGLDAACRMLSPGCGVVGGDLATAPVLTAAVTALGDLEGRPAVRRDGARPGDTLAYAGELGLSGLGLSLLYGVSAPDAISGAVSNAASGDSAGKPAPAGAGAQNAALAELWERHPAALAAHLAPVPPIPLGVNAAVAGATAMMDVSDSLSIDAGRLATASGVTIDFDSRALLRGFGDQHSERSSEQVPLGMMLTGGEDHGLLASFPAGAPLPKGFVPVGVVRGERTEMLITVDGDPYEPCGWDPYTARPAW